MDSTSPSRRGLAAAKGDYAVVMDCDLQDPPSLIPTLLAKLGEGYDLVFARRATRTHSAFRRYASRMYFKILGKIGPESIDSDYGTYSILTRKVINAFLLFEERERHYLFILRWLGFRIGNVDFEHQQRYAGKSAYTLGKLVSLAIDGVLFQSTVLLRWIVGAGFIFALAGVTAACFITWRAFFHSALPGWTSLIVLILLCTGTILVSLGVLGMYVSKIFDQSKQRPLYVVDVVLDRRIGW